MDFLNVKRDAELKPQRFSTFTIASIVVHVLIFASLFFWMGKSSAPMIVAAGPGEGGEGGGGAVQVGVSDGSEILGFKPKKNVSYLGDDTKDRINNERLQFVAEREEAVESLPDKKRVEDPEARKTNLPVATKEERLYSKTTRRGASGDDTASVGSTYGSPKPAIQGGIGIGAGTGGLGTGLPGGSEYGRRIQTILSRNFTPPQIAVNGVSNVVVYIKISRDGKITSVVSGRVPRQYFKISSANDQLNFAAERAIIATAAQGLPPFPVGFLSGVQEAVAEVWFQYP